MRDSSILKAEYLASFERDGSILILIDDDPRNLKEVHKLNEDVILLKDSALVDDTARKLRQELNAENSMNDKTPKTYTIKEILEREPKRAEDSPEYRKAVRATNERIREYELSQARMYAEADKCVAGKSLTKNNKKHGGKR